MPIPFFLLVCGYSFILIIDKVLFDTHAILGHDGDDHGHGEAEDHGHNHGSMLRQSIAKVLSASQVSGVNPSQLQIESAVRKSLAQSLRKSDVFASRVS